MTATNRGGKRAEADFYPTPAWCVEMLLAGLDLPGGAWLEPGAGDGAIIRATLALRGDVRFTAVELRDECRPDLVASGADEVVIADFQSRAALFAAEGRRFRVAIGNPPFSAAEAFALLALELADHVVMLERLAWLSDAEVRRARFAELRPDLYDIGRVDFNGEGGDSAVYAWHHWGPGDRRRTRGTYVPLERPPATARLPGNLPPPRQLGLAIGGAS